MFSSVCVSCKLVSKSPCMYVLNPLDKYKIHVWEENITFHFFLSFYLRFVWITAKLEIELWKRREQIGTWVYSWKLITHPEREINVQNKQKPNLLHFKVEGKTQHYEGLRLWIKIIEHIWFGLEENK